MQSFQTDANRRTLHQRPLDEDENVLSSQETNEEQQSLRSYVHDLQTYTSQGLSVPDLQHSQSSLVLKKSQQAQKIGEPGR